VLLYGMLVLLALVYIYPFLVQVATSFKTEPDAAPTRSR
jgi:multiple sugar transport system permease protein